MSAKAGGDATRREVEQMAAGASRNEFTESGRTPTTSAWKTFEVVKLMVDDLNAYSQRRDETGRQSGN